jgi:hypothetical protein
MPDKKPPIDPRPKQDKTVHVQVPNDNNLTQGNNINPKTGQNINKMNNNPSERRQ